MSKILADGQELELPDQPLTILVHPWDMNIEAPDRVQIDPETTVATAKEIPQEEWALIRAHDQFLKSWNALWDNPPPESLEKSNLAVRHTVGMILLLIKCRCEDKSPLLQLPETYMHPQQQARIMQMVFTIYPNADQFGSKESAHAP